MPAKTPKDKLDQAVAMYLSHPNGKQVAAATGVATSVLYRELLRRNVDKGAVRLGTGKTHWNSKLTDEQITAAANEYRGGTELAGIARKLGVAPMTISTALKKRGVTISPRGNKPLKVGSDMRDTIQELWDLGHTQTYIAKQVGLHQATISGLILSGRVKVGARKMKLSKLDYDQDGGVTVNAEGYRLLHRKRLPEWVAAMANASGYVPEHRAVMAKMLGRTLTQHETVHHIDGNKLNNKPSNLQLRQGRHGKGVVLRCACCGSTDIKAEELA